MIQGVLCLLFLLTGCWFMCLITAPLVYYHTQLYVRRKHLVDVTEIFNLLNAEKKYSMIKLVYYLILFFIVIYRLVSSSVIALLEGDDDVVDTRILWVARVMFWIIFTLVSFVAQCSMTFGFKPIFTVKSYFSFLKWWNAFWMFMPRTFGLSLTWIFPCMLGSLDFFKAWIHRLSPFCFYSLFLKWR